MYQLASFDQTDGGCYGKAHQTQRSAVLSRPYLSDAVHSRPRRASSQAIAWCTGDVELTEKLGRNDLCPCGSGKRFKQCCLKSGKYDGSYRDYYFQGAPVKRRSDPSIPKIDQRALTGFFGRLTPGIGIFRIYGQVSWNVCLHRKAHIQRSILATATEPTSIQGALSGSHRVQAPHRKRNLLHIRFNPPSKPSFPRAWNRMGTADRNHSAEPQLPIAAKDLQAPENIIFFNL